MAGNREVGDLQISREMDRDLPITVVGPKISVLRRLGAIWRYRELLWRLIGKEIRVKYKNSFLGFLWSMLNPAMYIGIYYVVFQKILKNGVPLFAIYLFCGLLVWNLFQAAVQGATSSIVANAALVKKVAFPREVLALASVGAAFVFFLFQSAVFVLFMIAFQVTPDFSFLPLVPVALIALLIVSATFAVFLSAVNVYLRDVQHLTELVLLAWFWAQPITYPFMLIQSQLQRHNLTWIYLSDPITPIVLTFQRALYARVSPLGTDGRVVHILPGYYSPTFFLELLGAVIVVGFIAFIGALYVFGRLEGNFAEEL